VAIGWLADGGGAYNGREFSKERVYETMKIGLGATEEDG
jgi:hypothetical protein